MSTTFVPKFDRPIAMTIEEVRTYAQDMLERMQGDADKADEVENSIWYQGNADALRDLLFTMTFPRTPEDARECVHDVLVWFGNECGECESRGYQWKDEA